MGEREADTDRRLDLEGLRADGLTERAGIKPNSGKSLLFLVMACVACTLQSIKLSQSIGQVPSFLASNGMPGLGAMKYQDQGIAFKQDEGQGK